MVEFFHLNPSYFPAATKDLLGLDTILKLGALPLGTKRGWWPFRSSTLLNVGFVNPKNRAAVKEVKRIIGERKELSGVQVYRLDRSEFLSILSAAYGIDRARLLALPETSLEPTIVESLRPQVATAETP